MKSSPLDSAEKFDTSRANEYGRQSRIALAGYDACQDLAACMLAASLGNTNSAKILVVGAGGTAQEIIAMAKLEPSWRFTAVDPSEPMLEAAKQQLEANNLLERTAMHLGQVEDLAADESYDAATLIGVLHHLDGDDAKRQILRSIRAHLKRKRSINPTYPKVGQRFTVASPVSSSTAARLRSLRPSRHMATAP
ncbi:class I SAM-dependent methyltransferase, partial [Pseudomonas extremaustralis]